MWCLRIHHRGHCGFPSAHSSAQVRWLVPPVPAVRTVLHFPPLTSPSPLYCPPLEGTAGTGPVQRMWQRREWEPEGEPTGHCRWKRWQNAKYQVQSLQQVIWDCGKPKHSYEDPWDGVHQGKKAECSWEVGGTAPAQSNHCILFWKFVMVSETTSTPRLCHTHHVQNARYEHMYVVYNICKWLYVEVTFVFSGKLKLQFCTSKCF